MENWVLVTIPGSGLRLDSPPLAKQWRETILAPLLISEEVSASSEQSLPLIQADLIPLHLVPGRLLHFIHPNFVGGPTWFPLRSLY